MVTCVLTHVAHNVYFGSGTLKSHCQFCTGLIVQGTFQQAKAVKLAEEEQRLLVSALPTMADLREQNEATSAISCCGAVLAGMLRIEPASLLEDCTASPIKQPWFVQKAEFVISAITACHTLHQLPSRIASHKASYGCQTLFSP